MLNGPPKSPQDIRRTHYVEQMSGFTADLAAILADYRERLEERGFRRSEVLMLVVRAQAVLLEKASKGRQ